MSDLISRKEAQECQRVAQKRRYTFGNDEFSLEAAYHDCKLVFDGITDDDSFQKADTGMILYYANEIIYALQETLEGKGTNALCNDTVSRQDAIDAVDSETVSTNPEHFKSSEKFIKFMDDVDIASFGKWKWANGFNTALVATRVQLKKLPSAEPEGKWTTEEVAELLFNLFGDECACNYNGIDEWLPERCKYTEIADECPNPKEKHGCWMQFLLQGGADMRGEKEETE